MKFRVFIVFLLFSVSAYAQTFHSKRVFNGLEHEKTAGNGMLFTNLDTVSLYKPNIKDKGIFYHLTNNDLFSKAGNNFSVSLNPALNFLFWSDGDDTGYINTRGARISGHFGKKMFFHTALYENQGRFQSYLHNYALKYSVLPGYARMKPYKTSDWDYSSAIGSVLLMPVDNVKIRLGHDKLFIGSGHRSLILSDAAFQQLFLQTEVNFGKFRYTNISMQWINPNFNNLMEWETEQSLEGNYQRKFSGINMLEYAVNESLRLGLFEAVVFETSKNNSELNYNMFNPLPGVRAVMIGNNTKDNIILGADILYSMDNIDIYSQIIIDDISFTNLSVKNPVNRFGWQVGAKYFDFLGIENLHLQAEHNYIKAGTYASASPEESFTHYNQNIAHPAGNNFFEFIGIVEYKYGRIPVRLSADYMRRADKNYAETLAPLDYNFQTKFLAGDAYNYIFVDIQSGFILNEKMNWLVFAGISYRKDIKNCWWFKIGSSTTIQRLIRDF